MPSAQEQKYSPQPMKALPASTVKDRVTANTSLGPNQAIVSPNKVYRVVFQTDGNLVLLNNKNTPIWSTNTANRGGVRFNMQADGNGVIYDKSNHPIWDAGTTGHPGSYFRIQDDGNVVIYQGTRSLWQSYTNGGYYHPPSSGGVFGAIASTLGGAAKGLAKGVSVSVKFSGKAFTDVTSSAIWKVVAGVVNVIPGIGTAVSAGMITASVIGKAASAKDAIIGAAREVLPGGEAAKAGFDVGVGIAVHGEGMTGAALSAVRNQLPDGAAKAGFDAALSMHAGRATVKTPAPTNLSPKAKAAYYTTKGLVNIKAPPAMKVAVAKMVVTDTDSHKGLQAAVMDSVTQKDISWLEWVWHELKHAGASVHATVTGKTPKDIITVKGELVS